jgi:hypothetical protein
MNIQERPPQVAAWKRPEPPLKSGFNDSKRKNRNSISGTVQSFSVNDAISEFQTAMLEMGLLPRSSIIADGKKHRCGTVAVLPALESVTDFNDWARLLKGGGHE